jgi:hypothetical protein
VRLARTEIAAPQLPGPWKGAPLSLRGEEKHGQYQFGIAS